MFEVTVAILLLFSLWGVAYLLWKNREVKVTLPEQKDRLIPAISTFDPTKDVTTVCPVPLASMGCSHDWDRIGENTLEVPHEKKYILVVQCTKCGLIDKTVQTTSKAPPPPPASRAECRHSWVREKSVTLDSPYEQMTKGAKNGYKLAKKDIEFDANEAPPWMFQKTYICVRICEHCGEIDKVIASNFEGDADHAEDEDEEKE